MLTIQNRETVLLLQRAKDLMMWPYNRRPILIAASLELYSFRMSIGSSLSSYISITIRKVKIYQKDSEKDIIDKVRSWKFAERDREIKHSISAVRKRNSTDIESCRS